MIDLVDLIGQVRESYEVRLPSYVNVSKKNTKAVNLNVYRNLHHHHLATQKKNFSEMVRPLLRDKPRAEKVWIHYTVFASRNGRLDTMNVGSVADKYFSDTLVEMKKIPDDNQDHVVLCTFSFGGVVPMGGHVIATVNILEKESEPMRILLDQDDIQAALDAYVKTLNMPNAEEASVEMSVSDDGEVEAEVIMGVKPKNKGGRPKGSTTRKKPTPKKEVKADVETAPEGSSDNVDSGGATEPEEVVEETAAEPEKPEETTTSKNLFGGEEDESSKTEEVKEEAPSQTLKPTKKSASIFDVD